MEKGKKELLEILRRNYLNEKKSLKLLVIKNIQNCGSENTTHSKTSDY